MQATGTVQATAADPRNGMTLGELREFVEFATQAGSWDEAKVTAQYNWRNGIKGLSVPLRETSPEEPPGGNVKVIEP